MQTANTISRAFYDIASGFSVLSRTAKLGPTDPKRALKEAKELRAKLMVFEAACREQIVADRAAAVVKRADDKVFKREQLAYLRRNPQEIPRAIALGIVDASFTAEKPKRVRKVATVVTPVGELDSYKFDPQAYAAEGLVAMALAAKADPAPKRGLFAIIGGKTDKVAA